MFIGRRTRRLNNENVVASDVFLDPDVSFPVGEGADRRLTEGHTNVFANPLGQLPVGRAGENLQFWLKRKHGAGKLGAQKPTWQSSKLANRYFFGE
jgi:hypothetical protein